MFVECLFLHFIGKRAVPRNVSLAKGTSDYNLLFKFHKSVTLNVFVFYIRAKILSVPDTSVTYFVLHSLNQFTDETKQCIPVQINTGAKFCSTISF